MTSKKIADNIFNIKEKLTDKEFKDIMDLLSIKNKEEEEDEVELYEFTYMKMRKPQVFKFDNSSSTYGYNFADYKIDILTFGQLGSSADITYNVPAGVPFNEVFVSLGSANFTYTYSPTSPFGAVRSIYGSWVYFNNSTSQLRIRKGLIVTIDTATDWDHTLSGYAGTSVNSYLVYRITTTATT